MLGCAIKTVQTQLKATNDNQSANGLTEGP